MKPDLDKITAADLKDNERLSSLYLEAVRRKFWTNDQRGVIEFWCFAEKALADDKYKTPGKLFYTLLKKKSTRYISDTQEQRALSRMPSAARQDLVDRADDTSGLMLVRDLDEEQNALVGRDIAYNHSVMMQCFLPQKALPEGVSRYKTKHGRAVLVVRAGEMADPRDESDLVQCEVPYGAKARIILPYIVGYAVRNNSPVIDLGRSLRAFMESVGMPIAGRNGKAIAKQINNIAAADFVLGQWGDERVTTKYSRVANEISFWMEKDPNQRLIWNPEMVLSSDFYEALKDRRVPVDMEHLIKLAGSPRRMDLYCWLSYRLSRVSKARGVAVSLKHLQPIFAPDIDPVKSPRLFKARLQSDLKAIGSVYSGFNVRVEGDIMWLHKSKPPVPEKSLPML